MIYVKFLFMFYVVSWNANFGTCIDKYNKYWVPNSLEEKPNSEDSRKSQHILRQEMNDLLPEEFKRHKVHKEHSKEYQTNIVAELEPKVHKLYKVQKNNTKYKHIVDFSKKTSYSDETTPKYTPKRTPKQKTKKKNVEMEIREPKDGEESIGPKKDENGPPKILSSELLLFARDLLNAYKNTTQTIRSSKNVSKLLKEYSELAEHGENMDIRENQSDKNDQIKKDNVKSTPNLKKITEDQRFRGRGTDGQLHRNKVKHNTRYQVESNSNYHTKSYDRSDGSENDKGHGRSYEKKGEKWNKYLEKSLDLSDNSNKVDKNLLRERKKGKRPARFDVKSNHLHKKRKHKKERMVPKEIEREGRTRSSENPSKVFRSTKMDSAEENERESTTPRGPFPNKLSPFFIAKQLEYYINECSNRKGNMNATLEVLDKTVSYYDIVLVKMTDIKDDDAMSYRAQSKFVENEVDKKVIFIVHGLSVMGTPLQYSLRHKNGLMTLLNFYAKHLEEFDVYVMPMANPDGFDKAEKTKYWNKNASPQSACSGVALDRNFDVAWNLSRKNISSCSQQYPGRRAFTEKETKAVRDVFKKYGHKIVAYLNLHSGTYNTNTLKGDAVLYPKGYTDAVSDDDRYVDLRGAIEEKLRDADFRVMSVTVDSLYNWYGLVAGTSVDYASTVYGIPYSLELVMQVYTPAQAQLVLTELWCRIIDVIFQAVYKYTQSELNKENK